MRFRPYDLSESNPEFLKYFFRNHSVRTQLSAYDNSITRANLSQSKLKDVVIIVPPRYEQSKIAGFLDEKCAEIDKVLEKTRASVEEYKKLKQSIITQAVTKGIRGDRAMKDSGIEWIGEVPEDWELIPFRHVLKERNEKNSPVKSKERLSLSIDLEITLYADSRKISNNTN